MSKEKYNLPGKIKTGGSIEWFLIWEYKQDIKKELKELQKDVRNKLKLAEKLQNNKDFFETTIEEISKISKNIKKNPVEAEKKLKELLKKYKEKLELYKILYSR